MKHRNLLKAIAPFIAPSLITAQQSNVHLIDQLAPGTWLENLAPRPNGKVLATELVTPRLWSFDPSTPNRSVVVHEFSAYESLCGITPTYHPDVFALIAGNVTLSSTNFSQPGSFAIWQVEYRSAPSEPIISKLADVPDASYLNGLTYVASASAILAADSTLGVVFAIDAHTGTSRVAVDDSLLKYQPCPLGSEIPIGANGLKYRAASNTLYWTNGACQSLNKIQLDPETGAAVGSASVVANLNIALDDFAIEDDASAPGGFRFYLADAQDGAVLRLNGDGSGAVIVAGGKGDAEISTPTAMRFADGSCPERPGPLYVTTGGIFNGTEVGAQFLQVDLGAS